MVELDRVSIHYGEKNVCRDISFTIKQGDRIALSGPNGSGKSSLLKLIRLELNCTTKAADLITRQPLSVNVQFLQQDMLKYGQRVATS